MQSVTRQRAHFADMFAVERCAVCLIGGASYTDSERFDVYMLYTHLHIRTFVKVPVCICTEGHEEILATDRWLLVCRLYVILFYGWFCHDRAFFHMLRLLTPPHAHFHEGTPCFHSVLGSLLVCPVLCRLLRFRCLPDGF